MPLYYALNFNGGIDLLGKKCISYPQNKPSPYLSSKLTKIGNDNFETVSVKKKDGNSEFFLQCKPDNLHKKYAKILCELSRMCELSMHRSQWGSVQLCKLSGMCKL